MISWVGVRLLYGFLAILIFVAVWIATGAEKPQWMHDWTLMPLVPSHTPERRTAPTAGTSVRRQITVWSNDLHVGLVEDLKYIWKHWLPEYDIRWIDKSLSVYCEYVHPLTCADTSFKQIVSFDDITSGTSDEVVTRFVRYVNSIGQASKVDIFVCTHPLVGCRLFLPFKNQSMIVSYMAVPLGFCADKQYDRWFHEYLDMARDPRHVALVNNRYHQQQTWYETGYSPRYLRNHCLYVNASYDANKTHATVLIARSYQAPSVTLVHNLLQRYLTRKSCRHPFSVEGFHAYGEFREQLQHKAVLFFPYTVSVMTFFEFYSANIPIFAPSLPLGVELEQQNRGMFMRKHDLHVMEGWVPPHDHSPFSTDVAWNLYWHNLSDVHTFPHVQHFSSYDDLFDQLCTLDAQAVSQAMAEFNRASLHATVEFWRSIFLRRFETSSD